MGVRRFFRRAAWDEERARELDSYLAEEIADNLARGLPPDEARRTAYRKLGNPTRIREEIYTMNSLGFVEGLFQDLRYGVRLLRRDPTFAVIAILTLALGTGANTAIFQLVDAVRLRDLPVDRPQELAEILIVKAPHGRIGQFTGRWPMLSYPLYQEIRRRQQVFSDVIAWGSAAFEVAEGGESRPVQALWVSGNFLPVLGVRPAAGRLIAPADDAPGCAAPGVVLGYAFWQREYGGDASVVGRSMVLDGRRLDVIGVTAPGFFGVDVGRAFDVALPVCAKPLLRGAGSGLERADIWFLAGLGRLKPGVTVAQASAQLASLSRAVQAATVPPRYTAGDAKDYLEMELGARPAASGISGLRRKYGDSLDILLGVTAIVLLIACANLANLMLARATAREAEIAVRLAIGGSRGRIVRQLFVESVLLAVMGAAAGLVVAQWFSRSLVAFLSSGNDPLFVDLALDWRAFAFTAALAVASCLLFGLTPAVGATAAAPITAMKWGGRGSTEGRRRSGLRRALVVAQISLSFVLVVEALLFSRSLLKLTTADAGFNREGLLTAGLDMRKAGIAADAQAAVNARIIARVRTVPGVTGVAQAYTTPLGGNSWNERIVVGGAVQQEQVNINSVGPDYLRLLGIRLIAGRDFDARDTPQSPPVAIVSESFARKYFPDTNAIGQAFAFESAPGQPIRSAQIVGVAADVKYADLREPFQPLIHLDAQQEARPDPSLQIVVATTASPAALTAALTHAINEASPSIVIKYQTVRSLVGQSLLRERLMARLSGFFGVLAVLIATIGLYGVMSYMVARRRVEIGVRMALGADAGTVVRMIVGDAGALLAAGLAIGAGLSIYAAATASALLYEMKPWDPATLLLAAASLGSVALLAAWIPARRASRLPPTIALRQD